MQAMYGLAGGAAGLARRVPESDRRRDPRRGRARLDRSLQWLEPTDGFVTPELVREALTDDTRALAVSLVDFRTGYRADLTALREVIGDRLLIVDAIQGFGVVDADYAAADVVCANGYKWVRAGWGTGFAWFGDVRSSASRPCSRDSPAPTTTFRWTWCPRRPRRAGVHGQPDPDQLADGPARDRARANRGGRRRRDRCGSWPSARET